MDDQRWPTSEEVLMVDESLDRCYFCWKLFPKDDMKMIRADEPSHQMMICEDCYEEELTR